MIPTDKTEEGLREAIRAYYDKYGVVPRTKDMEDWYSWCRKRHIDFRSERDAALPFSVRTEAMLRDEILAHKAKTGCPPTPHDMQAWYHWCDRNGLDFVSIRDSTLGCRVLPGMPTMRTEEMFRDAVRTFIEETGSVPSSQDMKGWYLWCDRYGVNFTAVRNQVFAVLDAKRAAEVKRRSKPQLRLSCGT